MHSPPRLVLRWPFHSPPPRSSQSKSPHFSPLPSTASTLQTYFETKPRKSLQFPAYQITKFTRLFDKLVRKRLKTGLLTAFQHIQIHTRLTAKRKIDVSSYRQLISNQLFRAMQRVVLHTSKSTFHALVTYPRLVPTAPLHNITKGLSKLHHSYLRDRRAAHYRSVTSKTLSLTLARDFTVNVLNRVVTTVVRSYKTWAWVNIRYLVGGGRKEGKRGERKPRNSRLEARFSLALSKLHPHFLLQLHCFSHLKHLYSAYKHLKSQRNQAKLLSQYMKPLTCRVLTTTFHHLAEWSENLQQKARKIVFSLTKSLLRHAISPFFDHFLSYNQFKIKQFRCLSRALQLIKSKERLQLAGKIQRLYRKLSENSLEERRKGRKMQEGGRSLGMVLRGMMRDRVKKAFDSTCLYILRNRKSPPKVSPIPSLYSATRLIRALYRLHSSLKLTLKSSLSRWKTHLRGGKIHRKLASQDSAVAFNTTTRPQTMTSQRDIGRSRPKSITSFNSSSLLIVSELLRSQHQIQNRVEAILRQSPSRSPLRANLRIVKEKVKEMWLERIIDARNIEKSVKLDENDAKTVETVAKSPIALLHSIQLLNTHLKHRQTLFLSQTLSKWRLSAKETLLDRSKTHKKKWTYMELLVAFSRLRKAGNACSRALLVDSM